jgi:ATP-dependent Clp protease ATP-binding subunit ClpB
MNKIFEILTNQLSETLESAVSLTLHNKNQEVEVSHIVWALLTNTNSVLNQLLNKMNIDKSAIELEVKSYASKLPQVSSVTKDNIKIGRDAVESLQKAQGLMSNSGDQFIAIDTWLIANLSHKVFKEVLGKYIDLAEARKTLEAMRGGAKVETQSADDNFDAYLLSHLILVEVLRHSFLLQAQLHFYQYSFYLIIDLKLN